MSHERPFSNMAAETKSYRLKMANFSLFYIFIFTLLISSTSSLTASSSTTKTDVFENRLFSGLNHQSYSLKGEITIGAFFGASEANEDLSCTKVVHADMWVLQYMEAIAFAVELINNDTDLLTNVSLGFVIVDYCKSSNIALAQSLSFLPMEFVDVSKNLVVSWNESGSGVFDGEELKASHNKSVNQGFVDSVKSPSSTSSNTSSNIALVQSLSFLPMEFVDVSKNSVSSRNGSGDSEELDASSKFISREAMINLAAAPTLKPSLAVLPHYDVVGVLGPLDSQSTLGVSSLFTVAKIPMVSYIATSDALSHLVHHPYFMRLVPPNKHQIQAMLTFITKNGWSYISVIYSDTVYGKNALNSIILIAPELRICIATSQSLTSESDFDDVLHTLLRYKKARVVIIFLETDLTLSLFAACDRAKVRGHFIWIGSDMVSDKAILRGQYLEIFHGAFTFMYHSTRVPLFESYFRKLRPGLTGNPWFNDYWESYTNCSYKSGSCLSAKSVKKFEKLIILSTVSLVIDSVFTFAHAINKLLNDVCPGVTGRAARDCVNGDLLLKYMLNSSFDGYTGRIEFDKYGDLIGRYEIRQMVWENEDVPDKNTSDKGNLLEVPVAFFETRERRIINTNRSISWAHLNVHPRIVPLTKVEEKIGAAESVCSRPCGVGEIKIHKESPCCWECQKCRENEILVQNNSACEMCDKFTWPDEATNLTTCTQISVSYGSISSSLTATLLCLAAVAATCQVVTASLYLYFRDHRIIKATSRELSLLQMLAIFVGYITVAIFQTTPTNTTCAVIYFMFCLSFTCLYAPMIVKAVRIYRIFVSSSKSNRRPRFVSPQSQLIMAGSLILVQVCLCLFTYVMYRPSAQITQLVPTEKFVELSCNMTVPGLASFITYNLLLLSVCSALAFKTRHLPDNFNESRFISLCVSTTLVIWLAFIPAYFTASREYVRVLLLSAALLINHTVALAFLFIPKVYAVFYATPDSTDGMLIQTNGSEFISHLSFISNKISPGNIHPN